MQIYLLAFSAAVLSSAFWPCLSWTGVSWSCAPFFPQCFVTVCLLGAWCLCRRCFPFFVRVSVVCVFGVMWAAVWGGWMKAQQLPLAEDKTDYLLVGVVSGVPQITPLRTRFVVDVESVELLGGSLLSSEKKPALQRVMLRLVISPANFRDGLYSSPGCE